MAENITKDITNVQLSIHASEIADQLKETGTFDDALPAAKFGMAYAIKYYRDELSTTDKLDHLDKIYDAKGKNYNIGSVDPDNYISQILEALYPSSTTPYRYARVLMCFGLNKLGDLLEEGRLFPISKNM
ncbi:hypothetical protein A7X67_10970 [Clostridium sp. W14A]|nr:hypothetical protein A7X67_10970 [Clostridium sp. W14A]